jgi:serine/threonine protein kinase
MNASGAEQFRLPSAEKIAAVAAEYARHGLHPGETVGVFRIREVLTHQGNVSTVYLAEATVDVPQKAIRRGGRFIVKGIPLRPSQSNSTNVRNLRSFFNEIRILPHVPNPELNNIVRLVDANGDAAKGKLYLAFEELAFKSVRDQYPDKRVDPEIVFGFARSLTRGLTHLHNLGIVHGDVKPDNFMIDMHGEAILVDFGSAFFSGRKEGGGRKGIFPDPDEYREPFTPLYCSPELARYKLYGGPVNPKDKASDSWALGVTLWELVTGSRPFFWIQGETLTKILEEIGRGVLPVRLEMLEPADRSATAKPVLETLDFLQTVIGRLLVLQQEKRLSCFEAHGEILSFSRGRGVSTKRVAVDPKTRDRLEMARRIAQMEEEAGRTESRGDSTRKRRETAREELRTLELRESYLESERRRAAGGIKGWFTPPPSPEEKAAAEAKGHGETFEQFRKQREGEPQAPVSFEDFARQRKKDEIQKLKQAVEQGARTDDGGDTRPFGIADEEDLSETSLDAGPPRPAAPPNPPEGSTEEDLAGSTDTQVDLHGPPRPPRLPGAGGNAPPGRKDRPGSRRDDERPQRG